jgi:hypothetical protein
MSTREEPVGDPPCDQDPPAARGTAAHAKKAYSKPVLSKYEQVHGIGIGGSL